MMTEQDRKEQSATLKTLCKRAINSTNAVRKTLNQDNTEEGTETEIGEIYRNAMSDLTTLRKAIVEAQNMTIRSMLEKKVKEMTIRTDAIDVAVCYNHMKVE